MKHGPAQHHSTGYLLPAPCSRGRRNEKTAEVPSLPGGRSSERSGAPERWCFVVCPPVGAREIVTGGIAAARRPIRAQETQQLPRGLERVLSLSPPRVTITRTRTHARTRARTHTHTRTHIRTHTRTHIRTCTHARTYTHTHTLTHARTRTHARTQKHTHTHTHTHIHTHAPTHTSQTTHLHLDYRPANRQTFT